MGSTDQTSLSGHEALLILPVCSLVKSFVVVDIRDGTLISLFAAGESVKDSSLRCTNSKTNCFVELFLQQVD